MQENNENKIIVNKDGKTVEYDYLFEFDCEQNGKTYIGYTDHEKDETGAENIYVSSINKKEDEIVFNNVYSDLEWEMINDVISQIKSGEV